MPSHSFIFSHSHKGKGSLNRESRLREQNRINAENLALLKRLQEKTPTYDIFKWKEERRQTEQIIKNIREFPESPLTTSHRHRKRSPFEYEFLKQRMTGFKKEPRTASTHQRMTKMYSQILLTLYFAIIAVDSSMRVTSSSRLRSSSATYHALIRACYLQRD